MPMVTNTCKKHGSAFPEDDCPQCVREKWEQSILDSEEFFRQFGGVIMFKTHDGQKTRVEDLYQHFSVRLRRELGLGPQ